MTPAIHQAHQPQHTHQVKPPGNHTELAPAHRRLDTHNRHKQAQPAHRDNHHKQQQQPQQILLCQTSRFSHRAAAFFSSFTFMCRYLDSPQSLYFHAYLVTCLLQIKAATLAAQNDNEKHIPTEIDLKEKYKLKLTCSSLKLTCLLKD